MKTKFFSAAVILLVSATVSVNAQTTTPATTTPETRGQRQHMRIKQGVQSGELTKTEADRLREKEKGIHQDVKAAKADGVVTKDEHKDIKQERNQASRAIYRKKHNKQRSQLINAVQENRVFCLEKWFAFAGHFYFV